MNPFPYTFDNKRYHTLAYHNRVQNCKTQKAVIDAGLSCPNIDGTCGVGGCIFCDGGSGYFTQDKAFSVTEQLQAEKVRIHKKSPESKIIAYFQTHTNTYAPVEKLRTLYEEALAFGVYGVSIATRPDCIGKDVLSLLKELNGKTHLTVELGLQSSNDETAARIHRGYKYEVFREIFLRLRRKQYSRLRAYHRRLTGRDGGGDDKDRRRPCTAAPGRCENSSFTRHSRHAACGLIRKRRIHADDV